MHERDRTATDRGAVPAHGGVSGIARQEGDR